VVPLNELPHRRRGCGCGCGDSCGWVGRLIVGHELASCGEFLSKYQGAKGRARSLASQFWKDIDEKLLAWKAFSDNGEKYGRKQRRAL
jgi:hypothetical protein